MSRATFWFLARTVFTVFSKVVTFPEAGPGGTGLGGTYKTWYNFIFGSQFIFESIGWSSTVSRISLSTRSKMSAWSTSEPYVEKFYLFSCSNKDELTVRLLTDLGTAYELRPMLLHPDRADLTPMEIAQYLCRVSTRVLVSGEKHQRLPKIVVDGVEDYGSSSWRDTGRLLRCWDDGRRSGKWSEKLKLQVKILQNYEFWLI